MKIKPPEFSSCFFHSLSICSLYDVDAPERIHGIEAKLNDLAVVSVADATYSMEVTFEHDSVGGHLHFEIFSTPDETALRQPSQEISEALERQFGQFAGFNIQLTYRVPVTELPKSGLIATLDGLPADVFGYDLTLTGAKMSLSGDTFTTLKWNRCETDKDIIDVQLSGFMNAEISSNILIDIENELNDGFTGLVLQKSQTRKVTQDDDNTENSKRMQA